MLNFIYYILLYNILTINKFEMILKRKCEKIRIVTSRQSYYFTMWKSIPWDVFEISHIS